MNLSDLKEKIKEISLNSGAKLVGVGNKDRLKDAPPSGDMEYSLPNAESCIIWVYPNPIEALENYFAKKERMSIKKYQYFAYSSAWSSALKIKECIEKNSNYKAFAIIPNGQYRKKGGYSNFLKVQQAYPPFSLRYGAVAAGLGHIGWSGNLVTKEYGGSLYLGGVITTAPLEPDPMQEENHCNKCKICYQACTTGYFEKDIEEAQQEVIIGGKKEIYGKRGTYSKCATGCTGWVGLSEDGKWTTWTPDHICLKDYTNEEWRANPNLKQDLMRRILVDKDTPKKIRDYNKEILKSYARVTVTENAALRPLEDVNPRCGNCNFICVADPKKRLELLKLLKSSGKIFLDDDRREFIKKIDENGKEIIYYPPSEEEFFSKEEK
ncbi:MAG: hypothetical protein EU547_03310 [Promethearchaeota archaeon]|nr:MAG: hypothetical protein EU547_03310 [Candidatus Lokiarchaeota archaeon]